MPPFHFADLALTTARRAADDPSTEARRLYDRPDASPDPVEDLRHLKAWWRLDRIAEVLGAIRGDTAARAAATASKDREAEAT